VRRQLHDEKEKCQDVLCLPCDGHDETEILLLVTNHPDDDKPEDGQDVPRNGTFGQHLKHDRMMFS
jgi:hypothetical protein